MDATELQAKAAQGEEDWNPSLGGAAWILWACMIGMGMFISLAIYGGIILLAALARWFAAPGGY